MTDKNKIPVMPFLGNILSEKCYAIVFNYGLHTQCSLNKCEDKLYCKKHFRESEKDATNLPNYGDIRSRQVGNLMEFVDRKGKHTVPYICYLKKANISKEDAKKEATKHGITIPEHHWVEPETKRKKKSTSTNKNKDEPTETQTENQGNDTPIKTINNEQLDTPLAPKKSRGRPQKKVEMLDEDSLLPDNDIKEDENEVELCKVFIHEGKTYLKSVHYQHVYDIDTEDYVGKYNSATRKIEYRQQLFQYDEDDTNNIHK